MYTHAQVFADLVGVPMMTQKKPYTERLREFKPFACSDFVIPLLDRLCPAGDKLDRWEIGFVPASTRKFCEYV